MMIIVKRQMELNYTDVEECWRNLCQKYAHTLEFYWFICGSCELLV